MAASYGSRGAYGAGRGGRFSDDLLDEIRAKSDIVAVISEYLPLKRRGSNYLGLCPFHQEKTPSFTVTPDKQMFYCFGCQTGGNVFTFLMKREGLTFAEAVEALAVRAGVALPERWEGRGGPEARADRERRKSEIALLYRALDFASRFYHKALLERPEAEKARLYLRRRGLKLESAASFRLGFAPPAWDSIYRALTAKGVEPALMEKAGLVLKAREEREGQDGRGGWYDRFRNRLMFTICDQRGRPIGFGARALDEGDEPKYLNSPETPLFSKGRHLYALHLAAEPIRRGGTALVVEGYMDAIACHEFGFDYAVASMGTAFTAEQARLLRRLTDTVVTAFDADTAGTQATLRGLEVLTAAGFKVKVAEIPGGKDPDECLRGGGHGATGPGDSGPEGFGRAVREAVPLPEYRFRLAARRHDTATIDGRVAAVEELVPVLASLSSPVELDEYVRDFSRRLHVSEEALRTELARHRQAARGRGQDRTAGGVRDSVERLRNNKATLAEAGKPGAGGATKQVVDAERVLLAYMVGVEDGLPLVLGDLLEAAQWCKEVGLTARVESATAMDDVAAAMDGAEVPGNDASGEPAEPLTETEASVLDWFLVPAHRRLMRAIVGLARSGPVTPARLVDALPGDEDAATAAAILFETKTPLDEAERAIRDCLGVLKEHRLNSRIEELHRRISDLERRGAQVELEYAELARELIDLERHTDGGAGHWKVPGD